MKMTVPAVPRILVRLKAAIRQEVQPSYFPITPIGLPHVGQTAPHDSMLRIRREDSAVRSYPKGVS